MSPAPGCRPAGGDHAEVERVELELLPGLPGAPLPAGRAGQGEGERLTVAAGPLGDDAGHEAAVVPRGELHGTPGRPADVEPVHPGVAGEDGVHQQAVAPSLGLERRVVLEPHGPPGDRRCPAPGPHRPGGHRRQPADDRGGRHGGPLAYLRGRHLVDHLSARPLAGRAEVVRERAERGLRLGHAEHVRGHRPHVPQLARRRLRPVARGQRPQLRRYPVELRRREGHRLLVPQRRRHPGAGGRCSRHGDPHLPFGIPNTVRILAALSARVNSCPRRRLPGPAAATAAATGTRRPSRRSSTPPGPWCAPTAWPPCPCERSRMPSTWSPNRSIPTSPPRTLSTTACSPTATWSWPDGSLTRRSRTMPAARCGPWPASSWSSPPRTRLVTSCCSCAPSPDSSPPPTPTRWPCRCSRASAPPSPAPGSATTPTSISGPR